MKSWTRLLTAVTIAATAVTLGLSSASASSGSAQPPSWQPPGSTGTPAVSGQHVSAFTVSPSVSQTVFVPITPCRIADTRSVGGALSNLAARAFYVQGTSGFAPQGGKSGGCGIPTGAQGVTANVTTTGATGSGYISAYPAGSAEPLSNFTSYAVHATTTVNPTFTLATSTAQSLFLRAHGGSVEVIIDATGYYVPQIEGIIAPDGSLYAGSKAIVSSQRTSTGSYTILTNVDVTNCAVSVTIRGGVYYGDGYGFGHSISVSTWSLSNTASAVPTDLYYSFGVTC